MTIHTILNYAECDIASFIVTLKVAPEDPEDEMFDHTFHNDDLKFTIDSLGHMVVRISAWDDLRNSGDIPVGDGNFVVSGICNDEAVYGMDDAMIIANTKK